MNDVLAMAVFQDNARKVARSNRGGVADAPSESTARERLAAILVALAVRLAPAAVAGSSQTAGNLSVPARA